MAFNRPKAAFQNLDSYPEKLIYIRKTIKLDLINDNDYHWYFTFGLANESFIHNIPEPSDLHVIISISYSL